MHMKAVSIMAPVKFITKRTVCKYSKRRTRVSMGNGIHELKTDGFSLSFDVKIFKTEIEYPVNAILKINVYSNGFSAVAAIYVDIKKFALFTRELLNLYQNLSGKVRLEESYGSTYMEFEAATGGHIAIKGKLHEVCQFGHVQELYFENGFDQTYLRKFANELFHEYSIYLR